MAVFMAKNANAGYALLGKIQMPGMR